MESISGNNKAFRHGVIGESLAAGIIGIDVNPHTIFDFMDVKGLALEIKTCAEWIKDGNTTTMRRRGRFVFSAKQHKKLVAESGYYLLCLIDATDNLIACKCIPAISIRHSRLDYPEKTNIGLVWTNFFEVSA